MTWQETQGRPWTVAGLPVTYCHCRCTDRKVSRLNPHADQSSAEGAPLVRTRPDKGISQPRAPLRSSATKKRQASTFASALLYRAVPLGAPMGAGLPWPVVCGADVVVFATSVTILLTP